MQKLNYTILFIFIYILTLQAQCSIINNASGAFWGGSQRYILQSITAPCAGQLTSINFTNLTGVGVVTIRNGFGYNAPILYSETNPTIVGGTYTLSVPLAVTNGSVYSIRLDNFVQTPAGLQLCGTDCYVGGSFQYSANGTTWFTQPWDLRFTAIIAAPCVPATPSVAIAITSGTNPSCAGNSVTFTATPTNGGAAPTYVWKEGITTVGTNSPTYTTTALTNGIIITCEITSNHPCPSPATATSNSINMTIISADIVRGNALAFNGTTNYVSIPHTPIFSGINALTLEAWVNTPNTTQQVIVHKFLEGQFSLEIFANRLSFVVINGATIHAVSAPTNFPINQLVHCTGVFDGSSNQLRLYQNGILVNTLAIGAGFTIGNATTGQITIGRRSETNTEFFLGRMDEVRLWTVARTAAQIRENMHLTLSGCETGLAAYYQMNEGAGTSLADKTGKGNNGTLVGGTAWATSTVNIGNDANSTNSESVSIATIPAGVSTQNFAAANLSINYTAHSAIEDVTVTYERFTPNATTGAIGTNVISNPMWTVNKSTTTATQTMNFTFTFPAATLTVSDPCQVKLYHRTMGSDAAWTLIGKATAVTGTTATFNGVTTTGQFMVTEDNLPVTDIVRNNTTSFDGTNDQINVTGISNLANNSFTIESWVKRNSIGTYDVIASQGISAGNQGLHIGFRNDNSFTIDFYTNGLTTPTAYTDLDWHHWAATYDASTREQRIYRDGVLVGSRIAPSHFTGSGTFTIGQATAAFPYLAAAHVQLEEFRVWSTARTPAQIRENMHLTLIGCETGLHAYYQMNEGAGTTVADKSGNGYTGTLVNGTTWTASTVNVGNDANSTNSESQTIAAIGIGTSTQKFAAANSTMRFFQHSGVEDITVTYQEFTPNSIAGATGVNIIQNPMWTVNKSSATATMVVDYTFTFAGGVLTSPAPDKYKLYWRAMNAGGNWTKISTASGVTATTVTFGKISLAGQFMVVQESDDLISDVRGNMYTFDGVDDDITIGDLGAVTNWTIETWFKPNGENNYENIFHTNCPTTDTSTTGVRLEISNNFPSGHLYFSVSGDNTFNPHTIIPLAGTLTSEWHHIAIIGDQTNGRVYAYLNGVQVTNDVHSNWPANFSNLVLGRGFSFTTGNREFSGSLDEVRIWSDVRTQSEIRENMHLTLKGNEGNLISYYQFNNDDAVGTANGVKDAMGTNHGTTVSMNAAAYLPSEVAVAGGVSDRVTIGAGGNYNFPNTGVSINFGATTPNGELVISRLETEKPHGWSSITGDVDNEYFVVRNYGTNGTFTVLNDMTFNRMNYISPADVGVAQASSPLELYKRASNAFGSSWGSTWGGADNASAGTNGLVSYDVNNNVTSFSQIVIVNTSNNSDLPIELLNFNAKRIAADKVQLDWATASELNNKGFYIERMLEVENVFEAIAFVDGKGTTTATSYYELNDGNSYSGVSYYRLKQVDFDGTSSYSDIRAVSGREGTTVTTVDVYPNPVKEILTIRFNELAKDVTAANIQVLSIDGRVLHEVNNKVASNKQVELGFVKTLPSGVYMVNIQLNNGERMTQKFVKE